jgi:hypothetical protein
MVDTTADSGKGSLRQAILDANASSGADDITFMIPGSGEQVIKLATELPAITEPLTINGYTQPGTSRNTLSEGFNAAIAIFIDGSAIPPNKNPKFTETYGLTFRGAEGRS